MLIRSQDGDALIATESVWVHQHNFGATVFAHTAYEPEGVAIAQYDTVEEAKVALNFIYICCGWEGMPADLAINPELKRKLRAAKKSK